VTVLYGRNGTGKSSVLRCCKALLSGIRSAGEWGEILVRVQGDGNDQLSIQLRNLFLGLRKGSYPGDDAPLCDLVAYALTTDIPPRITPADAQLAQELAEQGLFALAPVGEHEPRWQVYVAARADEASPSLTEAVRTLVQLVDRWHAPMEDLKTIDTISDDDSDSDADWADFAIWAEHPLVHLDNPPERWLATGEGHPWAPFTLEYTGTVTVPGGFVNLYDDATYRIDDDRIPVY